MDKNTKKLLISYAERYETSDFLIGDPSWFMHQVEGKENQEAMALIASSLSYGSRQQFMKKIQAILDWSGGDADEWVRSGRYRQHFQPGDVRCFYRLFSFDVMYRFLTAYERLLQQYGTLGDYVRREASDGLSAVDAICRHFARHDVSVIIPKDMQSACKRVCMFMRWMVRSGSPVDLGLWADFIDRRSLIIPLDTHVVQQSIGLGLLKSRTATMRSALQLTAVLSEVFPEDPLKGDFALFGQGVKDF